MVVKFSAGIIKIDSFEPTFNLPLFTMYSLPITSVGTIWSPIKSKHPPPPDGFTESSLIVTETGLLAETIEPLRLLPGLLVASTKF